MLASNVMEQRPVTLTRTLNQPSADLPAAQALQAQMEETYGPPSHIDTRSGSVTLTYAWGTEGFIPDLDGQTPREITYLRSGFETTDRYVPCRRSGGVAFDTTTESRGASRGTGVHGKSGVRPCAPEDGRL